MENLTPEKGKNQNELISELTKILEANRDKRIVVVGTTCTGKSTLIQEIKDAHDMDELVFPLLSKEEDDYVCQKPWTSEIGQTMIRLVKEKVKVEPGKPVFGTVVLDSDLIIYLHISDELLEERTNLRNHTLEDAKNMQKQIEEEIKKSQIPVIKLSVG
ncbi:MAG: hypothetical protein AAB890_00250 [Patescibacteria group bacterium]